MSRPHVVWDFDGVIVDSAETIKTCYRETGVAPPDDILSQEHVDWITPQGFDRDIIRQHKNRLYISSLLAGQVHELRAYWTALRLRHLQVTQAVMTGAPFGSLSAFRFNRDEPWPFTWWLESTSTRKKMEVLEGLSPRGVYIDDQECDVPEGWGFIHFTRQMTADKLAKEIHDALVHRRGVTSSR
jgi:hypothetical protein